MATRTFDSSLTPFATTAIWPAETSIAALSARVSRTFPSRTSRRVESAVTTIDSCVPRTVASAWGVRIVIGRPAGCLAAVTESVPRESWISLPFGSERRSIAESAERSNRVSSG